MAIIFRTPLAGNLIETLDGCNRSPLSGYRRAGKLADETDPGFGVDYPFDLTLPDATDFNTP
jgi:hypothetical protein